MDVLNEIPFAVPPVSHSCKKISKHNTSWSPHIFFYIYFVFFTTRNGSLVWTNFSWIHGYTESLAQNERYCPTLGICTAFIFCTQCPRQ